MTEADPLTGEILREHETLTVYPASHFVTGEDRLATAVKNIEAELEGRLGELEGEGKVLEAYRLKQRTQYDLEMMRELGYTSGIENYSRHIDGRPRLDAVYASGLLPRRLRHVHRRVAHNAAPGQGHVQRRQEQEDHPGRIRLQATERSGQPSFDVG